MIAKESPENTKPFNSMWTQMDLQDSLHPLPPIILSVSFGVQSGAWGSTDFSKSKGCVIWNVGPTSCLPSQPRVFLKTTLQ